MAGPIGQLVPVGGQLDVNVPSVLVAGGVRLGRVVGAQFSYRRLAVRRLALLRPPHSDGRRPTVRTRRIHIHIRIRIQIQIPSLPYRLQKSIRFAIRASSGTLSASPSKEHESNSKAT